MARFSPKQTVASVVQAAPAAASVLARHGIDVCCGGAETLGDACRRHGLAAQSVLDELEHLASAPPAQDWSEAPLARLIDHIVGTHHAFARTELTRLSALVEEVVKLHGATHPEVTALAAVWRRWAPDLELHLEKEERVLFPVLKNLLQGRPPHLAGGVDVPVGLMEWEHEEHAEALGRLRALAGEYAPPAGASAPWRALWTGLEAFERDFQVHAHLENNVLFPRIRLLSAAGIL